MLLRRSSGESEGERETVTDGWVTLAAAGVAAVRRGLDMVFVGEGTTLQGL